MQCLKPLGSQNMEWTLETLIHDIYSAGSEDLGEMVWGPRHNKQTKCPGFNLRLSVHSPQQMINAFRLRKEQINPQSSNFSLLLYLLLQILLPFVIPLSPSLFQKEAFSWWTPWREPPETVPERAPHAPDTLLSELKHSMMTAWCHPLHRAVRWCRGSEYHSWGTRGTWVITVVQLVCHHTIILLLVLLGWGCLR